MPYTPDATSLSTPGDSGVALSTAPGEFRALKTYIFNLINGVTDFLGSIQLKNTFGLRGRDGGGVAYDLIKGSGSQITVGATTSNTKMLGTQLLVDLGIPAGGVAATQIQLTAAGGIVISGSGVAAGGPQFMLQINIGDVVFGGGVVVGRLAAPPAVPYAGMLYYDITLNTMRYYKVTSWVNI